MDNRLANIRSTNPLFTIIIWLLGIIIPTIAAADETNDKYAIARSALISAIRADVIATSSYIGTDRLEPEVMKAMASVKRHRFVPEKYIDRAYGNHPLPIGYGQTISQPYIVALMTNLLALNPGDRVLEVGTGSGYQAAVLAEMGMEVFSIEIVRPLAEKAIQRLEAEGYDKVRVKIADGYFGWEEYALFDAIIVTAAADHIPPPLLRQLKPGGRMVIPVGGQFSVQQLVLVSKDKNGILTTRQILPVRFVPLTRNP